MCWTCTVKYQSYILNGIILCLQPPIPFLCGWVLHIHCIVHRSMYKIVWPGTLFNTWYGHIHSHTCSTGYWVHCIAVCTNSYHPSNEVLCSLSFSLYFFLQLTNPDLLPTVQREGGEAEGREERPRGGRRGRGEGGEAEERPRGGRVEAEGRQGERDIS